MRTSETARAAQGLAGSARTLAGVSSTGLARPHAAPTNHRHQCDTISDQGHRIDNQYVTIWRSRQVDHHNHVLDLTNHTAVPVELTVYDLDTLPRLLKW